MTNSGGPPTFVATTDRPHAIASSVASPNGSTRLGWQTTSAAREPERHLGVRHGAGQMHARPTLERAAQRPVSHEGERPLAVPGERAREAQHVLPLGEGAGADERRPVGAPAELRARLGRVSRREAVEIHAAVDDLHASARLRCHGLEPRPKPARDSDDPRRPADREARGRAHGSRPDRVLDVLAVSREHGRRAPGEHGEQAGGHEEVRVRDVRAKPPCGRHDVPGERRVAGAAAAAVDDRPGELVPPCLEARLQLGDERAEVGRVRAGVHLGDEQDAHASRRYRGVTWTMPRHISSVVPSPHST